MYAYAVGKPYNAGKTVWPEMPALRLTAQGTQLLLFYRSPTDQEISAIRTGKASFGWIASELTGVLAFRFHPLPWADVPYTPHREQPDDTPGLPEGDEGQLLVQIVLVDADTGIIRALRALTWPERFTKAVRASVQEMLDKPFNAAATDAALDALYARYPQTDQLVRQRADVTCTGGTFEAGGPGPDA
jgi:hypothetical protein